MVASPIVDHFRIINFETLFKYFSKLRLSLNKIYCLTFEETLAFAFHSSIYRSDNVCEIYILTDLGFYTESVLERSCWPIETSLSLRGYIFQKLLLA